MVENIAAVFYIFRAEQHQDIITKQIQHTPYTFTPLSQHHFKISQQKRMTS
jgi:hypothetical protein